MFKYINMVIKTLIIVAFAAVANAETMINTTLKPSQIRLIAKPVKKILYHGYGIPW